MALAGKKRLFLLYYVASTGIEPVSGASETHILSIVLRGHMKYEAGSQRYETGARR